MIITLTGSNTFALKKRLDELTSAFVKAHGELALERFDAEDISAQQIIDSAQSLPFLASKKMVVVREPSVNKEVMEAVEQIITAAGDTTDLIIYDPAPDKRTAYFKSLQKQTKLEQFNELDSRDLAKWLASEATKQDSKLSLSDATYLVGRVGANQLLLSNELDKLLTYDATISRASIELLTEPTPQSKIFDLLDAAFGGNKKRALQLYEEQRAQKVEPQAILAMLAWQLQLLVLVKLGEGKPADTIARDAGMKPYPVNKAAGLVRQMDTAKVRQMVSDIFNIDWQSKTTAIDLDEALKNYIITI